MIGLSDGRKSFQIRLVVLIQYRLWQTATQPPTEPASHVAVAITLHAKASSLKTGTVQSTRPHYIIEVQNSLRWTAGVAKFADKYVLFAPPPLYLFGTRLSSDSGLRGRSLAWWDRRRARQPVIRTARYSNSSGCLLFTRRVWLHRGPCRRHRKITVTAVVRPKISTIHGGVDLS